MLKNIQRTKGKYGNGISPNWDCQQRDRNFKKEPQRNSRLEKYNNWNKKQFTRAAQNRFKQAEELRKSLDKQNLYWFWVNWGYPI